MSVKFDITVQTFYELGGLQIKTLGRTYPTREEAFFAAIDHAVEMAGPDRDGYRRPTVSVVTNHDGNLAVRVGDGNEASYTMFVVYQCSWDAPVPEHTGRGYVISHV
ncbi:Uncharacterised protein [Mycobacteroides abscessus subsp. abscessus]|uniref:hypothetical protein n=1 Tax=Mycobacteroides abscessus TaxID=36809 RepID=UPI000517A9C6|nr:hypothetical protein [Mycobacteroides abscessus]MDM1863525.1 hypothetical protein [Mycobacteroides abscessus]MDM1867686.1 hypothetical protein [Mycobacteroides abscessus]MDM1872906.1 hypothetical protein [Mycobacteroides abscessus]MDM1877714.1 hypothetical protein [Mycobacteroides abscessus]MDM1883434.1 hypothetical protein [Mycobacteroides abscessus]